MPFSALRLDASGVESLISIIDFPSAKTTLAEDKIAKRLLCPFCRSPMFVRQTMAVRAHFAHYPSDNDDCPLREGESLEHMEGKWAVREYLRGIGLYKNAELALEACLAQGELRRIADILVTFKDQTLEVHEIQFSSITTETLEERTAAYLDLGVTEIVWWFAGRANNEQNRRWAQERFDQGGTLEIRRSTETVRTY